MEELKQFWNETMEIPEARWIVAIAGLVICLCVAYYFVKLFRDMALGTNDSDPTSFISEFQKLRDEGQLDEEEYAKVKKTIPKQLPDELMGKKDQTK